MSCNRITAVVGPMISVILMLPFPLMALNQTKTNEIRISRTGSAPALDGVVDDPIWREAAWFDAFVQRRPDNGAPPSVRTAFAVVFDDRAIYFAVRCQVAHRDDIVTRLVRRDQTGDFDHVEITLAPRLDGRTGYSFLVNPSGVQLDKVWNDDRDSDWSWDAVWHAQTRIGEHEWTAEIAIPLDQIRFPPAKKSWGLQVGRWIAASQEHDVFNPVPNDSSGWVSAVGRMVGTEKVEADRPLALIPEVFFSYRRATADFGSRLENGIDYGIGGYGKLGLAADVVLDVAINPDFGQVEVDEVVLNLSAYETRFPEKRPFFLESAGLFDTPIQLFYSRRFGAAPPDPVVADNETVVFGPLATPILSAVKLTGRTERGLSLGVLDAVFMPTELEIENSDTGQRSTRRSTPWTNAATLRLVAETGDRGSSVGVLATAVNPSGSDGSYAGGLDWNLFSENRTYSFRGQVAGQVRFDEVLGRDESHGAAMRVQLGRDGGEHFRFWAGYVIFGKGFDPNDLGYLWRDDLHRGFGHVQYRQIKPFGPFLELYTGVGFNSFTTTDWLRIGQNAWSYFNVKWANHWRSEIGVMGGLPHHDDRETRGGPNLKRPGWAGAWLDLSTPQQKVVGGRLYSEVSTRAFGYAIELKPSISLRLGRMELSLIPAYNRTVGDVAFVDTVSLEGDEEATVIGRRDVDELNVTFKGTLVLLRDLTLQVQSQLMGVVAFHHHFERLFEDSSSAPQLYDAINANYSRTDLNLQGLLRWEFLPGSAVYLVYTHLGFVDRWRRDPRLGTSLSRLDEEEREQLLMLKLSYLIG